MPWLRLFKCSFLYLDDNEIQNHMGNGDMQLTGRLEPTFQVSLPWLSELHSMNRHMEWEIRWDQKSRRDSPTIRAFKILVMLPRIPRHQPNGTPINYEDCAPGEVSNNGGRGSRRRPCRRPLLSRRRVFPPSYAKIRDIKGHRRIGMVFHVETGVPERNARGCADVPVFNLYVVGLNHTWVR